MKSVSVVMATYNGAEYIEEQLASLAGQTVLPLELIVSDDGSVDGTLGLVERFRETAPFPVIVSRNERNLGYGENFLTAARRASGDYIAFCDQDDVWEPDKVRLAVERLTEIDADLFVHRAAVIDGQGMRVGAYSQGITRSAIHPPLHLGPWAVTYGCSMVFTRALLQLVDPAERGGHTFEYEGLLSHDLWIYFLASTLGCVIFDDRELVRYRQHGANVTPSILRPNFVATTRSWFGSLGKAADPRLRRGDIARHRALLMERLSVTVDEPAVRRAAAAAAGYWGDIAEYEDARVGLYAAAGVLNRAMLCLRLGVRGAYRPYRCGGLGAGLLLKDVLVGVLRLRKLVVHVAATRELLQISLCRSRK